MGHGISRFSCPGNLSNGDMITVNRHIYGLCHFSLSEFPRRFRYRKSNL